MYDTSNDGGVECPYCEYVYDDGDLPHEDGQWECTECEREFSVEVEYNATFYSTTPESEREAVLRNIDFWENSKSVFRESEIVRKSQELEKLERIINKNNAKHSEGTNQ